MNRSELNEWAETHAEMPEDRNDIPEKQNGIVSECCGASMYEDSDICPECKEHCQGVPENDGEEN